MVMVPLKTIQFSDGSKRVWSKNKKHKTNNILEIIDGIYSVIWHLELLTGVPVEKKHPVALKLAGIHGEELWNEAFYVL